MAASSVNATETPGLANDQNLQSTPNAKISYTLETNYGIKKHLAKMELINPLWTPFGVVLVVGSERRRLHAFSDLLYAQSDYFCRELHGKYHEVEFHHSNSILMAFNFPNLFYCAVKSILDCLKTGTLSIYPETSEQILRVIQASQVFELKDMGDMCLKLLKQVLAQDGNSSSLNFMLLSHGISWGPAAQEVPVETPGGMAMAGVEGAGALPPWAEVSLPPPQGSLVSNFPVAEQYFYYGDKSGIPNKRRRLEGMNPDGNTEEAMDESH